MTTIQIEQLNKLHLRYLEGESLVKLAKEVSIDPRTLSKRLKESGHSIYKSNGLRQRNLQKDYFKNINSQDKAYLLGLLASDGNVCNGAIKIKLQRSDRDLLVDISNLLLGRTYLYEYNSEPNATTFKLGCEQMAKDLHSWGIVPNKTYSEMRLPNINKDLIRHYIRGFFDGDGTVGVYFYKNVQRDFSLICSSKIMLENISEFLLTELGIDAGCLREKSQSKPSVVNGRPIISTIPCYVLSYRSIEDLKKIYIYLYKGSNLRLERKKDKLYLCTLIPSELEALNYF